MVFFQNVGERGSRIGKIRPKLAKPKIERKEYFGLDKLSSEKTPNRKN